MKTKLTDKQRDNLEYVLEELPKHADQYPHIREQFTMTQFGCFSGAANINECDTHGCLLGHIATLPRFTERFDEYLQSGVLGRFDYDKFASIEFFERPSDELIDSTWHYLFSGEWVATSFDDAMDRVRRLLDYGYLVTRYGHVTGVILNSVIEPDEWILEDQPHKMWAEGKHDEKTSINEIRDVLKLEGYIATDIKICHDDMMCLWQWSCKIHKGSNLMLTTLNKNEIYLG